MTRRRLVLLATFAAVLALAAGVVGWSQLGGRFNTITLTAQFDSAAGLYVGNTVAVLGMPVGQVTAITPKGSYVEVQFTVDDEVKIPADAQAVTISNSILTDRQIELTPAYREGPVLAEGDTIGLNRTKTPIEFARVLDVLDKLSASLRGDGQGHGPLADVVNASAAIADGNGQQMKDALGALSDALRMSSDRGEVTGDQLTTIIGNLSSLMQAAADNDATLREFGSGVRQLSQVLADEHFGNGTTGKKIDEVLAQVGEVLQTHREAIRAIVANGDTAMTTLTEHQRDLAEFLDLTPMTLDNLYNIVDRTNGSARAHVLVDKVLFDTQTVKEVCNMMGLRQLGCSTGTLQDFGPDFGLSHILDGMTAMGQR
ncbi:MlaD family protein [Mycolicibacterium bacteremicum]|nr:MCE family protein [Mycolicibacterium bacteremicum]